jgi:hypothetical protein
MFKTNEKLDLALHKTILFKSRYDLQNKVSSLRENRIRNYQKHFDCTREYAVRYVDYKNYQMGHYAIQTTAGLLYMAAGRYFLKNYSKSHPVVSKSFNYYPLLAGSFYVGWKLYDKLRGYYLNFDSTESNLHWYTDYAEKFQVKRVEKLESWRDNLALTPMEKYFNELQDNTKQLKLNNDNLVLSRHSKDRDDLYYMFGKVRNLENIVYLSSEDLQEIDSPVKLQIKLDSVTPTDLFKNLQPDEIIYKLHKSIEQYKIQVENSKKFRSDKEKLLGLPFLMDRLKQYPEPEYGTWQYDLFKDLYGEEYNHMKGIPDIEEKINKYNYHLFLHPSVISKYDTNSEEFEQFLRMEHYKSKTNQEVREERRKHFCKNYMPWLNLLGDKKLGIINNKQKDTIMLTMLKTIREITNMKIFYTINIPDNKKRLY